MLDSPHLQQNVFISFFNSEVFKNGYLKAFFWEPPRLHAMRPLDFLVIAVLIE